MRRTGKSGGLETGPISDTLITAEGADRLFEFEARTCKGDSGGPDIEDVTMAYGIVSTRRGDSAPGGAYGPCSEKGTASHLSSVQDAIEIDVITD
ncbi:trypsin-like serine protease [Egibacter rhizosphaerae]|uniref:trypsin-like serine protease n=1 Tax=Egibacter rhizosphaerae TaxID=1670831 RepID=UPI003B82EF91